tara:strand:+ start:1545 stop:2261 length:717 start_codon:yes stop_codon:yes gene_type:complete
MSQRKQIQYQDGEVTLAGTLSMPAVSPHKHPAVIVVHDWSGKNEFACQKADELAKLGYIGFALDMYGDGKIGETKDEKIALMQPLMENRALLNTRIQAALNLLQAQPEVDHHKIAAIGFCFGGLCVLDLARSGAHVAGVVSFHGLLGAPEPSHQQTIQAKILALHGYDDPMVTPEQVIEFANEMTTAKADWQLDMYGNTMHAFTNPDANDSAFGTVYKKQSSSRAWQAMTNFLEEIFI